MKAETFVSLVKPGGISTTRASWVRNLVVEMRPHQWLKNLPVLAPLLFSQNLFVPTALGQVLAAFVLFCLVSSSIYLLNDIQDREQDRLHPQKRYRPLAAGALDMRIAVVTMAALFGFALIGGVSLSYELTAVLCGYWFLNLLYSLWLKCQVILDVFTLAAGFVLRVIGGAVVIQVEMSHWLLLCTTLLALFLGFSKRRHELTLLGANAEAHRQVLGEYNLHFLDMIIGAVTASTVISYALYTISEETVRKFHTQGLSLTLPFVLYGIFRYLYLVYHRQEGGDPTQLFLTDTPLMVNICLWLLAVGGVLYW